MIKIRSAYCRYYLNGAMVLKQESHRLLGRYLLSLLPDKPQPRYCRAFLIGCVEPDRNPLSYLKGSFRAKWLHGHNYQNAANWIDRMIERLERHEKWNIADYYTLGKLIHYTADAFTYVHNNCFNEPISAHLAYETQLQEQFLQRLDEVYAHPEQTLRDLATSFRAFHAQYLETRGDVFHDCRYILEMTARVFWQLLPNAVPACA